MQPIATSYSANFKIITQILSPESYPENMRIKVVIEYKNL